MADQSDYKFEEGLKRSIRNLEEIRFKNRDEWIKEIRLRHLDRAMVSWEPFPEHEETRQRWLRARGIIP